METVTRIFNIATSLVGITRETIKRIDIQEYKVGNCQGYSGRLYTDKNDYLIRKDGTIDIIKKEDYTEQEIEYCAKDVHAVLDTYRRSRGFVYMSTDEKRKIKRVYDGGFTHAKRNKNV